jgi:hypothetical protein
VPQEEKYRERYDHSGKIVLWRYFEWKVQQILFYSPWYTTGLCSSAKWKDPRSKFKKDDTLSQVTEAEVPVCVCRVKEGGRSSGLYARYLTAHYTFLFVAWKGQIYGSKISSGYNNNNNNKSKP